MYNKVISIGIPFILCGNIIGVRLTVMFYLMFIDHCVPVMYPSIIVM